MIEVTMTEEMSKLIGQIHERTKLINSLATEYHSVYYSGLLTFEGNGRMSFLRPDRVRSETTVNGKVIISIRNGTIIKRYSPVGNEVWQYDLKDLPQNQPINFGTADITDPLFAVDAESMHYEGLTAFGDTTTYTFLGKMRALPMEGILDTRKGFNLQYKPRPLQVQLHLFIDFQTGLLLQIIGTNNESSELFKVLYKPIEINGLIDESLFKIDESTSGYRTVEMKDIMISAMNPDYADQPPSKN
jgi:outer membrane lipoprotein-sorting protein